MWPEDIALIETSQTQKDWHCIMLLTCGPYSGQFREEESGGWLLGVGRGLGWAVSCVQSLKCGQRRRVLEVGVGDGGITL